MQFQKGTSGNPTGRPLGVPDKRTAMRELLAPHAAALVNKLIELALGGDVTALRICIDRLIAPVKARDDPVNLRCSLEDGGRSVLDALARGEITADEAAAILRAIALASQIAQGPVKVDGDVLHLKDEDDNVCYVAIGKITAVWEKRDKDRHPGFVFKS